MFADSELGYGMFQFPAYRNLKKVLGELDACVEVTELAIRAFNGAMKEADGGERGYIEAMSEMYRVRVNAVEAASLVNLNALLNIVVVHQALERFLYDFKREHPSGSTWTRETNEDLLSSVMRAVGIAEMRNAPLAFRVCDFYRVTRNAFMHPSARDAHARTLSKSVGELATEVSEEPVLSGLPAPNSFDSLSFDDFILFTRCAKAVARDLSDCGRLQHQEMLDWVDDELTKNGRAGRLAKNPKRLRNLKVGMLRTTFSISAEEAESVLGDH